MSILYNLVKGFLIMALDHEAIYEAYKTATKPVVSITILLEPLLLTDQR